MAFRGAFRATSRVLGSSKFYGGRPDVNPNLTKWWRKHVPTDGEVIRHLSPYETNVVGNWMKTWPDTLTKRAWNYVTESGPAFAALIAVMWWAESYHHGLQNAHRD